MNPILKLAQQIKDAEGISLASVIKKVEGIRVSEEANNSDIKKVAQALLKLKKEVDAIPLSAEVKKLQKAIEDAEKRVSDALTADIKAVKTDIRDTEKRLRQEIELRIPDIITVTEKVTEIAKEIDESEMTKVLARVGEESFVKKIRDVIEGLEGDERLDATKLKNLPQLQVLNTGGGGSNLSVFSNGTFVSSSTRLNFVGATVTDEGGRTKVTITGGGGISDGDKGDVTVSDSGATWTIDNGVVTGAKIASATIDESNLDASVNASLDLADTSVQPGDPITDLAGDLPFSQLAQLSAHQVLGRAGAGTGDVAGITMGNNTILGRSGSGDVDDLSASQVRTILNVADGATANAGTVTSVAVSGSDGIEVDSGSPVTGAGTIALGVNKTSMLSHLNVEDGADVTDATNVTAAGALMDSEVTDLVFVKALSDADVSTVNTGTSTTGVVTPDALAGSYAGTKSVSIQVFDGATNVATGDGKAYITIPESLNGMDLIRAQATVVTAGTTNATTVMIHNKTDAVDMLSGAISIASGGTVGTVGTINTSNDGVATNDVLRIDVDSVSTTPPQGLQVVLEFKLP